MNSKTFKTLCVLIAAAFFWVNAAEPLPPQYLVDENFAFIGKGPEGKDFLLSGWDVRADGGKLTARYHTFFKIESQTGVSLNRKIKKQNKGLLTLETRWNLIKEMEVKWELRSGELEVVSVMAQSGRLWLEGPNGTKRDLRSLPINRDCGLKLILDLDTQKTDLYVDGKLLASGESFKNESASVDNFHLVTGDKTPGEMNLALVKIHRGYFVHERFLTGLGSNLPEDWKCDASGGSVSVQPMNASIRPDVYSLKLEDSDARSGVSFSKDFSAETGNLFLEYKILLPEKTDGIGLDLVSEKNQILRLTTANGKWSLLEAGGKASQVQDFVPGLWHHFKIRLDTKSGKAQLFINGKLAKNNIDLPRQGQGLTGLRFSTGAETTGTFWLDDILLYNEVPYPEDYVKAPISVNQSKTLVGIQNCSMWREGHHLGWDLIAPYPDRKPALGFYDEGSPEVADWEIKWLAEHGVDFQIYCWFKPGSDSAPVKDPYMAYGLHDGYFNARYSDKMKFAILWENSGYNIKGNDDFRKNLLPFWMEYYFKDPRYLKIDNKPVFCIYRTDLLTKSIGKDAESVRVEMDFIRAACKKAGFDGAVLLAICTSADKTILSDLKTMGFEGIYAYTWGTDGKSPEIQKAKMEWQQKSAAGIIDMTATLSHGLDCTPWFRPSGGFINAEELRGLFKWTREKFIPSLPEKSLGKKMVILDNWNEFGEGHFMMPTSMEGFGYLDAIREFVGAPKNHEDLRPTPAQLERINVLFPEGRKGPDYPIQKKPKLANVVKKGWTFDTDGDVEGWRVTQMVEGVSVSGGCLSGKSTGRDPGFMLEGLNLDISEVGIIRIKIKNQTSSDFGQFYFGTEADNALSESKATRFYMKPDEKKFLVYDVEMWRIPAWRGKLKTLRFDPADSEGEFQIDSIELIQ
ncbi:MAG: glycoside hydrolase family 99-like domain-containing protein [Spirochaetia bacterium]|nr:glycoside hydrolase family 99-like domain-containing protein [Spirochaetia bacterium]